MSKQETRPPARDDELQKRLLRAIATQQERTRSTARRLTLEIDGAVLHELEPGPEPLLFQLPPDSRSLTLRDENDTVRAFVMLDESEKERPETYDDGRLALRLHDHDGQAQVSVRALPAARKAEPDEPEDAGELPFGGLVPPAPESQALPAPVALSTRQPPRVPVRWHRWLQAAAVVTLLGTAAGGAVWYEREQTAKEQQLAREQEQLDERRAALDRLKREIADREAKMASLSDDLKNAKNTAERERIQRELAEQEAAASAAKKRMVGGSGAAGTAMPADCAPGDPMCGIQ